MTDATNLLSMLRSFSAAEIARRFNTREGSAPAGTQILPPGPSSVPQKLFGASAPLPQPGPALQPAPTSRAESLAFLRPPSVQPALPTAMTTTLAGASAPQPTPEAGAARPGVSSDGAMRSDMSASAGQGRSPEPGLSGPTQAGPQALGQGQAQGTAPRQVLGPQNNATGGVGQPGAIPATATETARAGPPPPTGLARPGPGQAPGSGAGGPAQADIVQRGQSGSNAGAAGMVPHGSTPGPSRATAPAVPGQTPYPGGASAPAPPAVHQAVGGSSGAPSQAGTSGQTGLPGTSSPAHGSIALPATGPGVPPAADLARTAPTSPLPGQPKPPHGTTTSSAQAPDTHAARQQSAGTAISPVAGDGAVTRAADPAAPVGAPASAAAPGATGAAAGIAGTGQSAPLVANALQVLTLAEAALAGSWQISSAEVRSTGAGVIYNAAMIPGWPYPSAFAKDSPSTAGKAMQTLGQQLAGMSPEEMADYLARMGAQFGLLARLKEAIGIVNAQEKHRLFGFFALLSAALGSVIEGLKASLVLSEEEFATLSATQAGTMGPGQRSGTRQHLKL